jgi:hypothetical protein
MATGMSSSSARAKYWPTDGSLGERPSYCSPISPITLNPSCVKLSRSCSSGILVASLLAGVCGFVALHRTLPRDAVEGG